MPTLKDEELQHDVSCQPCNIILYHVAHFQDKLHEQKKKKKREKLMKLYLDGNFSLLCIFCLSFSSSAYYNLDSLGKFVTCV